MYIVHVQATAEQISEGFLIRFQFVSPEYYVRCISAFLKTHPAGRENSGYFAEMVGVCVCNTTLKPFHQPLNKRSSNSGG